MDKHDLSERDICTKFITPAIRATGWQQGPFREEVRLTGSRVIVPGRLAAQLRNPEAKGGSQRADSVLEARPGIPLAVMEADHWPLYKLDLKSRNAPEAESQGKNEPADALAHRFNVEGDAEVPQA